MPSMVTEQSSHELVVVRSKLFVIGSELNDFQVFDNNFKTFVALKPPRVLSCGGLNKVIAFGSKFYVLQNKKKTVVCYDVDKGKWSNKKIQFKVSSYFQAYAKIPCA